ncbi:methyl-accepting chemotaxis protein [Bradyrhizobium sp. 26S5]|uniref:methyl-accepting chemotaxis protein n=1 Tax=Bradyrhizobium sp. 26S5 TaxID=3139729 RepID=UPI0030D47B01
MIRSISARMIVAITLVAAGTCCTLAAFSMWQQQTLVATAAERELQNDYLNLIGALNAEIRTVLAVAEVLAAMPQLREAIHAQDRNAALAALEQSYSKIKLRGLELVTIARPPGIGFARSHNPKIFGDDLRERRKTIANAMTTRRPLGGVEAGTAVLNVFGSAPIKDGDDVIGVADVGAPFGKAFVDSMKARFHVDVAIHQLDGEAVKTLASTFSELSVDLPIVRQALAGKLIVRQAKLDGRATATAFGQILGFSGEPIAVFEIARDTGAYQRLIESSMTWMAFASFGALLLAGVVATLLGRNMAKPIRALGVAMRSLAGGEHTVVVPGAGRVDEIGEMAGAVEVFKTGLIEADQLRGTQEAQRIRAQHERRDTMNALASRFEKSVGTVVDTLGHAAGEMRNTAQSMAANAEKSTRQSSEVVSASNEAAQSAEAVAAAVEELNASIGEIAQQVNESARVAGDAASQANSTNGEVQSLAEAAQKIGDVVKLISEIAEQTNLLALNATIEAARAGAVGQGFAVVASEVKALAAQTSNATEDIAAQIGAIQSATRHSAESIQAITLTIHKVSEISSTIAAAVEEQGAATLEISRNVSAAARGTSIVSQNIAGVSSAARETGLSASRVVEAAEDLSQSGEDLRTQVDAFLREVRGS